MAQETVQTVDNLELTHSQALQKLLANCSNYFHKGAPFFVFSIDFINFCAGFSQAAKPVWHFDCVWRTRKAVDSRPCEPLLFRSACILGDLPPSAARGLTVELSIEGFTDRAAVREASRNGSATRLSGASHQR